MPRITTLHSLSPSRRKQLVEWIEGAKRPETRAQRVEKARTMLAQGKCP
jgi:uncharacterized protein YdeI (YjbR/CyaY-like superfamily)